MQDLDCRLAAARAGGDAGQARAEEDHRHRLGNGAGRARATHVAALAVRADALEADVDGVGELLLGQPVAEAGAGDGEGQAGARRDAVVGKAAVEVPAVAGRKAEVEDGAVELRDVAEVAVAEGEPGDVRAP